MQAIISWRKGREDMKKGRLSYSSREALRGILFIAPWLIGFVFLFLRPFISAVIYSFNDVDLSSGEVVTLFRGFGNYVDAFADDTKFIMHLTQSLGTMVYQVPLVVFFSLFIATVLNQKFKSRGFFRAGVLPAHHHFLRRGAGHHQRRRHVQRHADGRKDHLYDADGIGTGYSAG